MSNRLLYTGYQEYRILPSPEEQFRELLDSDSDKLIPTRIKDKATGNILLEPPSKYKKDSNGVYMNLEGYKGDDIILPTDDLDTQKAKLFVQEYTLANKLPVNKLSADDYYQIRLETLSGLVEESKQKLIDVSVDSAVDVPPIKQVSLNKAEDIKPKNENKAVQGAGITNTVSDLKAVKTQQNIEDKNKKVATFKGKDAINCYIVNLLTNTRVEFLVPPESVSESLSASFEAIQPKARTSPIQAYSNSGPHEYSFSVSLFDDYLSENILVTVRKLQALAIPGSNGANGFVKAPKCRFVLGNFIDVTGVCSSVSVEWSRDAGYKDGRFSKADVSFSITEVETTSRFNTEWESNFAKLTDKQ